MTQMKLFFCRVRASAFIAYWTIANKPTLGQSSCRLVNSQTSQLADNEVFLNHGKIKSVYCKNNADPNPVH